MNSSEFKNITNKKESEKYWVKEIELAVSDSNIIQDYYKRHTYEKSYYNLNIEENLAEKITSLSKNNEFLLYTFLVYI